MNLYRDIVDMWSHTYRTNKLLFWLGAIGTVSSVIASLVLNLTITEPNMWIVMIFFTIGSVSLATTSYIMRDSWMVLLMTWYTFINTVGMMGLAFS